MDPKIFDIIDEIEIEPLATESVLHNHNNPLRVLY